MKVLKFIVFGILLMTINMAIGYYLTGWLGKSLAFCTGWYSRMIFTKLES